MALAGQPFPIRYVPAPIAVGYTDSIASRCLVCAFQFVKVCPITTAVSNTSSFAVFKIT